MVCLVFDTFAPPWASASFIFSVGLRLRVGRVLFVFVASVTLPLSAEPPFALTPNAPKVVWVLGCRDGALLPNQGENEKYDLSIPAHLQLVIGVVSSAS